MVTRQENGSRWCSHSDHTLMPETATRLPLAVVSKRVSTDPGSYRVNSRHQRA